MFFDLFYSPFLLFSPNYYFFFVYSLAVDYHLERIKLAAIFFFISRAWNSTIWTIIAFIIKHDVQLSAFVNIKLHLPLQHHFSTWHQEIFLKFCKGSFRFNHPEYFVLSAESHKVSFKNTPRTVKSKTFLSIKPNISPTSVDCTACADKSFIWLPYSYFWTSLSAEDPRMTFWM